MISIKVQVFGHSDNELIVIETFGAYLVNGDIGGMLK